MAVNSRSVATTIPRPAPAAAIPDEEARLIRRAQAGDREAFGELYLRHRASVLRYLRSRLGDNVADVEDIAAEVFLKAMDKIGSFRLDADARFENWLIGIARNNLLVRWDWQKRHPETELPPESDPALTAQVLGPEEMVCLRLELARLLARLTPTARQVMVLQYAVGLSRGEVAYALGLTKRTIRLVNSQARAALTETPNSEAPASKKGARILPPALCACGCGVELPADRSITQRCATHACRDRLRTKRQTRRALQRRLLDVPAAADPAVDGVLAAIAAAGRGGITRADLRRRLRLQAARLDRIAALLSAHGLVREQRESVAQKPTTRYYALARSVARRAA